MTLRSLIPFRERTALARPDAGLFGSLQREVDRLFEEFARGIAPASMTGGANIVPRIDVTETDKEIEITAEMPGLERKDVEISLDDGMLTIRGEKKEEVRQKEDDKKQGDKDANRSVHVTERSYGVFLRMLELPPGIDPGKVQATMSKGVLKITMPKPARPEPMKIEVKEAA